MCQALYLEFCVYHPIFTKPDEPHYIIYIFQSRKLNFIEMNWPLSNNTGRRQDST